MRKVFIDLSLSSASQQHSGKQEFKSTGASEGLWQPLGRKGMENRGLQKSWLPREFPPLPAGQVLISENR